MSKLVVEVCRVEKVDRHPNADRLAIATVKGWKTCIAFDPATGRADFKEGDLCVYFPPDSVLPAALANSPHKVCTNKECSLRNKPSTAERCPKCGGEIAYKHGTPGRTGAMDYCSQLPVDEISGTRPAGGRVKAARLRGVQSFGFIMRIDPSQGDDPNWAEGTDVQDHFGVAKWEPPLDSEEGDAAPAHPRFHGYTDIEHYANFPSVISDGEEVVVSEKIHGKNCRLGLILAPEDNGAANWLYMAGSHANNRKEFSPIHRRFKASELLESMVVPNQECLVEGRTFASSSETWEVFEVTRRLADTIVAAKSGAHDVRKFLKSSGAFGQDVPVVGASFTHAGASWEVVNVVEQKEDTLVRAEALNEDGTTKMRKSQFWLVMTDEVRALLAHIRDEFPWREEKTGIVLFGELFGSGVQSMTYGLSNGRIDLRVFDIAINHRYVNYDDKSSLCRKFNVPMAPILYRGPFTARVIEEFTAGPTTMCKPEVAGAFKGREGVVITPVLERLSETMLATGTNGRVILKSVSADYLALQDMSDAH